MNAKDIEDDLLPTCTDLELVGYRTKAGQKNGEPDLVWIESLAAFCSVKNAIENGLILKPRPRTNKSHFTI